MNLRQLKKALFVIASLPNSLQFNIRTFGFKGIRLPILIAYNTKVQSTYRGAIQIEGPTQMFMITFGYGGSNGVISNKHSELCLEKGSVMRIAGPAHFAEGCSIRNSGVIDFGKNCGMNKNCFVSCYNAISIGDELTAGWNVSIRDSDGHTILKDGKKKKLYAPVIIGDRVWLCSYSDILKGSRIGNHCVVAYRSLVTRKFENDNVMIAGHPGAVIQENIDWEF